MSLSAIPRILRDEVFRRDGGRCRYCRVLQFGQSAVFHVNHVKPRSKGGPTVAENLVLQCPHCSLRKSDKTQAIDPQTGDSTPLFHPLQHRWDEHFSITSDGTISGKSAIGRATILALGMNELWPKSARALQIAAGCFEI